MKRSQRHALEGDLRSFPPTLLLQMMQLGALDGLLHLRSRQGDTRIYFRKGKLVLATGEKQEALGTDLVNRGLVERSLVEKAVAAPARSSQGHRLGTILVQRGHLERRDLDDVLRKRIQNVIYDLVAWREGRFTFEPAVQPADDQDILLDMPLESLLLESMKRLDDARRQGEKSRA